MKRSTIIVIVIIFISIAVGGVLGFYFYLNSKQATEETIGIRVPTGSTGSFGNPSLNPSVTLPGNASSTQPEQSPEITSQTPSEVRIPALRKIHAEPVSGAAFFSKDIYATTTAVTETVFVANGTSSASSTKVIKPSSSKIIGRIQTIDFMERATGHVYETATSSLDVTKIANTTIPKIYEALFVDQNNVILRNLYGSSDSIHTMFGTAKFLTPTSTTKDITTVDLKADIAQIALSPSKTKVFSLFKTSPTGIISNPDGSSAINAFDLPYKEWLTTWPNEKMITLTTKASAFADGYMYTLNVATKALQKVMGGKKGLTTLMSPDGNKVLYTESSIDSTYLSVFDVKTKSSRQLFFRTFAEKCIWSTKDVDIAFCAVPQDLAAGDYPDVWYQGLIFFNDQIWKINTNTGETQLVAVLSNLTNESIDVVNPVLNSDDTYLMFNNKADLSLWGLRLVEHKPATTTASTTPVTASSTTR